MKATLLPALLVIAACAGTPSSAAPAAPPTSGPAPVTPAARIAAASSGSTAAVPPPAPAMTPGVVVVGEVVAPPTFDPKPTLAALKPELLRCYNETRLLLPDLHGKLTLRLRLNDTGAVTATESQAGGQANDAGLVACIGDAAKAVTFPKPGGTATITVPLVFRQ
jgi:hypothetical protein